MAIHVLDQPATDEPPIVGRFLISRPVVSPLSLSGRGTRGFWAVDVLSRRVVFVKDTWRTGPSEGKEGDTLKHMAELGVRNIPVVVEHGDVPTRIVGDEQSLSERLQTCSSFLQLTGHVIVDDLQTTRTDFFKDAPWIVPGGSNSSHISRRKHYHLVLGSVGYDIRFLRGTEELLHASYDVFTGKCAYLLWRRHSLRKPPTAMRDALDKDSRLHRDLSAGNIILEMAALDHPDYVPTKW